MSNESNITGCAVACPEGKCQDQKRIYFKYMYLTSFFPLKKVLYAIYVIAEKQNNTYLLHLQYWSIDLFSLMDEFFL